MAHAQALSEKLPSDAEVSAPSEALLKPATKRPGDLRVEDLREQEQRAATSGPMSPIRESINSNATTSSPPDRGSMTSGHRSSMVSTPRQTLASQEFVLSHPLPEADTSAPLPLVGESSSSLSGGRWETPPPSPRLQLSAKVPRMRAQSSNADFRQHKERINQDGSRVSPPRVSPPREGGRMLSKLSADSTDSKGRATPTSSCSGAAPYTDCISALQMKRISSGPEPGGRHSSIANDESARKSHRKGSAGMSFSTGIRRLATRFAATTGRQQVPFLVSKLSQYRIDQTKRSFSEPIANAFGVPGIVLISVAMGAVLVAGTMLVWYYTGLRTRELVYCLAQTEQIEITSQVSGRV